MASPNTSVHNYREGRLDEYFLYDERLHLVSSSAAPATPTSPPGAPCRSTRRVIKLRLVRPDAYATGRLSRGRIAHELKGLTALP